MSGRASLLCVALALATQPSRAQTDAQRSGARAAAAEGAQAFTDQHWAAAADLFTRAESVIHSPVHLLFLARSYEKLGSLVKAHEAYLRIMNEQIPASAPDPWRDAKSDAQKESQALEPRIPTVKVDVQPAGQGSVTVTVDGVEILPALLGVPQPIDPGEHRFEAVARGMDRAVVTHSVNEATHDLVVIALRPADGARAGSSSSPAAVTSASPQAPTAPPEADSAGLPPALMWTAFGVGAVGLTLGTVFAISASKKVADANGICSLPGGACPDDQKSKVNSLDDGARSAKTLATVGFVAGGVGVAAGVTLLMLSPGKKQAASTAAEPWIGLGSAGVRGRF
jgi:hypothetical protein